MIKKISWLLLFLPLMVHAQSQGIKFENGLTFEQIKAKAKAENKYIFMDCYATWCGPCKLMDQEVFSKEEVGAAINANFISVRIQMDTAKTDNEQTKACYAYAAQIRKTLRVFSYPTFLFFSPDGQVVHREVGAEPDSSFLKLAKNALNPSKQYYTMVAQYQLGKKNYETLAALALRTNSYNNFTLAKQMADDEIINYLLKLNNTKLYTRVNINFITAFTNSFQDPGFELFVHDAALIDSAMGKNFTENFIDQLIITNEINPKLPTNGSNNTQEPDWQQIANVLQSEYPAVYVGKPLLICQVTWFDAKKDWYQLNKYYTKLIEDYGLDTTGVNWAINNNVIYDLFFNSQSKANINKLLKWEKIILEGHPNDAEDLDTYSNLLYKAGKKKEALRLERRAILIKPSDMGMKETLQKMTKGQPTWL